MVLLLLTRVLLALTQATGSRCWGIKACLLAPLQAILLFFPPLSLLLQVLLFGRLHTLLATPML